ncbi:MAG: hypothetical protein RBT33_02575 [Candidatus Dojkabacteria bacterium]|jgi:hypothetical protein|nr:hypothetical protein [Candidatus Dojkabacteria bacterium]
MEEEIQKQVVERTEIVEKPKKKGKGCLIALLVFLTIFVLIIVGGYLGYKKIVNGFSAQDDLGVTYSRQDLQESFDKAGFTGDMCIECSDPIYSEPHEIDVTFSNSQASAWLNYTNHDFGYGQLDDIHVRFTDDKADLSGMFTYQGKTYPVFLSGSVDKATDTTVQGNLDTLKVSGVSLPAYVTPMVESVLLEFTNEKLAKMGDTLRIDTLEISGGGLHFQGLAPSKIEE